MADIQPAGAPESASHRLEQLNSLLVQEVSQLVRREVEFEDGVFVTISRAIVAPDAESAKVFVSVFPDEKSEGALKAITDRIMHLQGLLNKRLHMKFVPKLVFALDHAEEKVASLNALLDAVEKDPTLTPLPKNGLLPPEETTV